jgi:hypothetical protein
MIGIATRPWAGQFGVEISAGERYFSHLQNIPTSSGDPPSLLFNRYWGSSPEVKQLGH